MTNSKLVALNIFIICLTAFLDSADAQDYNRTFTRAPARGYDMQRGDIPGQDGPSIPLDWSWLNVMRAGGAHSRRTHPCEQGSCYPATGNLLIGRKRQLHASSTCGLRGPERFCIVSHLKDRKKCFFCDANSQYPKQRHGIENIVVGGASPEGGYRTWWQAENGVENVSIRFNLEAEFHFTHLISHFQTFRPAAMLIERSYDFGQTWQVYRYFAHDCAKSFPGVPTHQPRKLSDVICDSRYSSVEPSHGGEVIFRVLPSNLKIDNPYSKEVQNLLKVTNLRINFTSLHTLGDDFLDNRPETLEKYYYAIKDMFIRGSCSCYGHASRCLPINNEQLDEPEMVHGKCECTHNTTGRNCERCQPFYNDLPWNPAVGKQANACRRCNCNNHAYSCHFDEAVYVRSGRVSGGVCDDCQHNTMGHNCELCKTFYYHDPSRPISDPEACQPCDCDPRGSLDNGMCDARTDLIYEIKAGQCHCKDNVEGRRCDQCKNGYWNFTEINPAGCQACTCDTMGTINNQGCNMVTGECTCKRYVTGRDCNQCLPEFWGLSEELEGCKPCDCDPGGAYNNSCDALTGQCFCRPHVTGRTCNHPEQNFYTGAIDYLIYEGEYAKGSDNCQVVIREPYRDGRNNTWTGPGFMQAIEDSTLNFTIDNICRSMWYDIIVRYEPKYPGNWDEAQITIHRESPPDFNGPCDGEWNPTDDTLYVQLPVNQRSSVAIPHVCLEQGKVYTMLLELRRYHGPTDSPTASILIDSIVLSPRLDSIPFFTGGPGEVRRQEYERYRCADYNNNVYYSVYENRSDIREICNKYQNSIGLYVYDGAHSCKCNPTGSHSLICDNYGGDCICKPNVVGRRCDRCAPGTYGFGPDGCRPCDCDSVGSLDNFCDVDTGRCKCRSNTYGRTCGQCEPGFWDFPHCKRCECNGHADSCDSATGACSDCRDFTSGRNCDRCINAFYGDPRIGVDIPCRPCPCPGSLESGHSYADSCSLDPITQDVICDCYQGYFGARCDACSENFYGNPEISGGKCQPCDCNNNTDPNRPGNCDPKTGRCLQCLFNTDGANCQICKADYYGDALQQNCQECQCDILGTDSRAGPCDHRTGQCPCLPHVIGKQCDTCEKDHWRIASGQGCDPCECDAVGSVSESCNPFDGTCECKPGFGGRRCNECQTNYWGNPNVQCYPCECDDIGSASQQCDRDTGICKCHEGIGGEKCDQCDRSYIGTAPSCSPCGECFDNWDNILEGLKNKTIQVINDASNIQKVGTTGIYSQEFKDIDNAIAQVKSVIESSSVKNQDLEDLKTKASKLDKEVENSSAIIQDLEDQLSNVSGRVTVADANLKHLKNKTDALHEGAADLRENANRLQEANVQGALNITQRMADQSRQAERMAAETNSILADAERYKKQTEISLAKRNATAEANRQKYTDQLNRLNDKLDTFKTFIPQLNQDMCGRNVSDCSDVCGGAGCDTCGGLSCDVGALNKAAEALEVAQQQATRIKNHKEEAEQLLRNILRLKENASGARANAQEAFDLASTARNQSDKLNKDLSDVNKKIQDLLNDEQSTPAEVRGLSREVLEKKIDLTPEEIKGLADEIAKTVSTLSDPDSIINETSDNLDLAKALKDKANYTKTIAQEKEVLAGKVITLLQETQTSQELAQEAIEKAEADIKLSQTDLEKISQITKEAKKKADDTVNSVNDLETRLQRLQAESVKNDFVIKQEIQLQASNISNEAKTVQSNAELLGKRYKSVSDSLNQRVNKSKDDIARAKELLKRASELTADTQSKFKDLEGMESVYKDNDRALKDLMYQVDSLNKIMITELDYFETKSQIYRQCE